MFDLIGHSVLKLRRARIGFLTDEKLKPGYVAIFVAGEKSTTTDEKEPRKRTDQHG